MLKKQHQTAIAILNRDDVLGNMHYATMLAYYAQYLGQTRMLQQTSNVHEVIVGFGTFGSEVRIDERYGTPTGIKAGGIGHRGQVNVIISKPMLQSHKAKESKYA